MSLQYGQNDFAGARALPLLIIADPRRRNLESAAGIGFNKRAGMLSRCRTAVARARASGVAVAILRRVGPDAGGAGPGDSWIKGLEPTGGDMVFEYPGGSCYLCRYFGEAAKDFDCIVLAGFIGGQECLVSASDAFDNGHRLAILHDAISDQTESARTTVQAIEALKAFHQSEICAVAAGEWIAGLGTAKHEDARTARRRVANAFA